MSDTETETDMFFSMNRLKLLVWSMSAGIIVAFFFSTNFLAWATSFNPGGSVMFISPLMCGLILGIVTSELDAVNTVIGTILMTITATICVVLTLFSPLILGIVIDPTGTLIFVDLTKNIMLTVILVLPLSLLGSILGRVLAESTLISSSIKIERQALKSETEEWYKMLEEKLEEKRAALEKLEKERDPDVLNVDIQDDPQQ
ncbi:MAG: hypothetical protein KKH41_07315 [Candidatus Thermoplasmatota archaeon]|nr:hypothetical protein [Euryarchaeota archaeon]MBU4032125.1 hypothetical protein [Candidatus Thermoplasmatota archaeon]MBU4072064.1 hypothetical protein [Candidatus Thermoplasmatota archaeon]MBU4144616.1 hypothetical protein [Candidatus Thermoplasmatota archaeon]MBU4592376.1 hypothetical protein [Candidatus Thermoplasmatota archaeon]